jgi:hypothetical protein
MTAKAPYTGPADRSRVDLSEAAERYYWADKWNVNQRQLSRAVDKVGPMSRDVARELGHPS